MELAYYIFLFTVFGFALVVFILLFFVSAPYGKFHRKGWGVAIKSKYAWTIMEFPSPALMSLFFILSPDKSIPNAIFILLWLLHYIHRTFIYPYVKPGKDKPFPVILIFMAFTFNILNGWINGYGVFHLKNFELSWLSSWQFITGMLLFGSGFYINHKADVLLRRLRNANKDEYSIPVGWLFRYISCPHFFGEIVEWLGWAVMTFSIPGLVFFVFTFANLFPRAISTHRWYRLHFPGYPSKRKAIIPFIV